MRYYASKFGSYSHSVSGVIIVSVCQVILQDHVIKEPCDFMPLMVSHHPAKFGGHRQCSSEDMTFPLVEGQDSTCPCYNP